MTPRFCTGIVVDHSGEVLMADALRAGTTIAHVALGGKQNSSNVKKGEERLSPCTQQEVVEAILVTAVSSSF